MIARKAPRGAPPSPSAPSLPATPVLVHWLVLVTGLSLLTALRIDDLDRMFPLWLGSVFGTAMGQLLARRRVRMWLFAFIIGNLMWLAPLTVAPLWPLFGTEPWAAMETFVMAFAPAAFCGYLSLSERGALLSFWFPAVPWMVAILDRSSSLSLDGEESWLLLGALAVLLLGLLRARESRRVALWRGHAAAPLARADGEAVLRQAPLRRAAQLAWVAVVGLATLALTGWIAPSLWKKDQIEDKRAQASGPKAAFGIPDGDPAFTCCPEVASAKIEQKKVKEYLPIHRAKDGKAERDAIPAGCVACVDGVPVAPAKGLTPDPIEPVAAAVGTAAPADAPPQAAAPQQDVAAQPSPLAPKPASAPAAPLPSAKASSPKSARARPLPAPRAAGARVAVIPLKSLDSLAWILALALSATIVQIALRPIRRLAILRHLQQPLWAETVDQRVSNLWQWMLIGLRDAGFQVAPGEEPHELARRVGLPGMAICATVLDRARHGVRVDRADLEAMHSAAGAVYRAARASVGPLARAAAFLRWPLT